MKKTRRIKADNLPLRSPVLSTAVLYLILDHFHAPAWLWGALGTLWLVFWIAWIGGVVLTEDVDLLATQPRKVHFGDAGSSGAA